MNDSKKKTAARRTHRFMTRDDLLVWLSRAWLSLPLPELPLAQPSRDEKIRRFGLKVGGGGGGGGA